MKKEMRTSFDGQLFNLFETFMEFANDMKNGKGKRIDVELGSELLVELIDEGIKFKSILVGMKLDEYLILRSPDSQHVRSQIYEGAGVVARCVHSGTVYGFRSKILCSLVHPAARLLLLEYPRKVETLDIRKNPRVDCLLPAEIDNEGITFTCAVADISIGGCKLIMKSSESRKTFKAQIGHHLTIRIQLPGKDQKEALPGIIRNVRADGSVTTVGLSFIDLGLNVAGALNEFIESALNIYSPDALAM